jgi:WD40 repeat protein
MPSRNILICILAVAFCAGLAQAAGQGLAGQDNIKPPPGVTRQSNAQPSTYESWIHDYRKGPLRGGLGDTNETLLKITVVMGDDLEPDPKTAAVLGPNYRVSWRSYAVSTKGTLSFFRYTPRAIQGGGPVNLPAQDFEELQPLIKTLPDDHSQLPPPGHRLVLQVPSGTGVVARVYDRANLPDSVLEILRLAGTDIKPLVTNFEAEKKWTLDKFNQAGILPNTIGFRLPQDFLNLAVSPDHCLIVRQALYSTATTQVVDAKTMTVVHEVVEPQSSRRRIHIPHARFTPDGRYLLLLSNMPAIRIYNTKTWQPVNTLPGMPSGGVAYYPSSDWAHGLVVSAAGAVGLWDAHVNRKLANLDLDGEIQGVSFSPDDSLVAVTSGRQNPDQSSTFHLRIWETISGKFVHELMPLEHVDHDGIGDPRWWVNGKYLLAPIREDHLGGHVVGIWNIQSGRYRGGFSGCGYAQTPFSILLQGRRLFKRCPDGTLYMWDVSTAVDRISEFERSLTQAPAPAARVPPLRFAPANSSPDLKGGKELVKP